MAHSVAVIVGSLRKESFSLKIAKAFAKIAPPSLKLDIVTLEGSRSSIRIWKRRRRRTGSRFAREFRNPTPFCS
jgi:hypothetical protein